MSDTYLGIKVDYSRDALIDALGHQRLQESYMRSDETSPQQRFAYVARAFGSDLAHAQRLYDYASQHWLSFATPILAFGRAKRGMPISCFLNYMQDTAEGLVDNLSETNWLSMLGGGVGIHVNIRDADEKSVGVIPHLKIYDASSLAYRQNRTRRGSYATFLKISHPGVINFLEMRKPTGDPNLRTHNLHHGICITDDFMQLVEASMRDSDFDDSWPLRNPNSDEIVEVVSARYLWQKILETRMHTGEPYIVFLDAANRVLPRWLKEQGLEIHGSNLCVEILLPTNEERTAVCCLSSVNLYHYDAWKEDALFLRDTLEMLDNVLQHFIDNAPDVISRARFSAMRERSVGVGAMGFHSYLQRNRIPFDSLQSKLFNRRWVQHVQAGLLAADAELCAERGPCPDAEQFGVARRCSHHMALAPNATSAIIMGNVSSSIELRVANAYRQDTLSGAYLYRNTDLARDLESLGLNNEEIWSSITTNDGSVQHLDVPDWIKEVYKTAFEVDQRWVVELAADRQEFIDQGQSLNLFFRPDVSVKYLHAIHFMAWKHGLKTLYYCRTSKIRKADKVGVSVDRKRIEDDLDLRQIADGETCLVCEG